MCFYVSNTCSQIRFYKGKKYNNIIRGTYLFQDLCKSSVVHFNSNSTFSVDFTYIDLKFK